MQISSSKKNVQKSQKKKFWEGLGLHLGGFWDGLGPLLATLGRLLAVFWAFKIELCSRIGPRWAPRRLLGRFGEGLGRIWGAFGMVLGEIWKEICRILHFLSASWAGFGNAWHDLALLL